MVRPLLKVFVKLLFLQLVWSQEVINSSCSNGFSPSLVIQKAVAVFPLCCYKSLICYLAQKELSLVSVSDSSSHRVYHISLMCFFRKGESLELV